MPRDQISKLQVGLAGEHLVAGQLHLRGYIATMTLKNYPGVDLFVLNPHTGEQTSVQVKSKKGGKMYYVPEKVEQMDTPFVFVYFRYARGANIPSNIEYYIMPAKKVASVSKRLRDDYLKKNPHVKPDQPRMIALASLAPYLDQWELIGI